jgi:hypothetical protein
MAADDIELRDIERKGDGRVLRSADAGESGPAEVTRRAKAKELAVRGARATRHGVWVTGRGLAENVLATASKLPVRDRATLRGQFPGRTPDEVADALVYAASRATGSVGAAVGVWAVLPVVPAFPVEVAAETLAVVGIEIKLVAELHEAYGMGVPGSVADRMNSYVAAWADRRGAVLLPGGLALAIGSPLRKRLTRRLTRRAGRSALSLGPLLTGAAAGAMFNRRETQRLGNAILTNLREDPRVRREWGLPELGEG